MSLHRLDGNMRAADAHHGQGKWPEEGDKCAFCEEGHLGWEEPENCSCHINAPCSAHENAGLVCQICGEAPDEQ